VVEQWSSPYSPVHCLAQKMDTNDVFDTSEYLYDISIILPVEEEQVKLWCQNSFRNWNVGQCPTWWSPCRI